MSHGVLIVDDSPVVRRLLRRALAGQEDLRVTGHASNGRAALAQIGTLAPDVVILDVEMPELDGLAALAELRRRWPLLPVIMFSALTERGAAATLDALFLGANDYVSKPTGLATLDEGLAYLRRELVPRIRALAVRRRGHGPRLGAPRRPRPERPPAAVVAIGVSTGGPRALGELLPALPRDFGAPILVVQHMPPTFTRLLAERLDRRAALAVREAVGGEELMPGVVWIAPGDRHLAIVRRGGRLVLDINLAPPERSCRPSVNVLMRSLAEVAGRRALAVVMTGMGCDGLEGARLVRAAGGQVLAQGEASSAVWGMPGQVARAGLADELVELPDLAPVIVARVGRLSPVVSGMGSVACR